MAVVSSNRAGAARQVCLQEREREREREQTSKQATDDRELQTQWQTAS